MKKLIKIYLKTKNPDTLHDIRVLARKTLANLAQQNKTDLYLKNLLKISSKVRDIDVLKDICKSKKLKKYLKKVQKKELKPLIKHLKNYKKQIIFLKTKKISQNKCKKICKINLLKQNDKKLHKIRIKIKKCRYALNLEKLKILQTTLGDIHDLYNCIKLKKQFNLKYKKEKKYKKKLTKEANKQKDSLCKSTLLLFKATKF